MILLVLLAIAVSNVCFAYQKTVSLTDKEIIERLTRLEEGQKAINQQLKEVQIAINHQLEEMNKRIDMLANLMYVIIGGIFALIGFVVWDRKSMSEQVRRQLEEGRLRDIILALREYGRDHPEFEEVLRKFNLL
jgi:hypothetical protein